MNETPGQQPAFVSPLGSHIQRYLQFKRAAGNRYREEERELGVLDRFLASRLTASDPLIDEKIIQGYLSQNSALSQKTKQTRLSLLRQLCLFIAQEEPRTAIPPSRFLGIRRNLFIPRIFTRAEARLFLQACACLSKGRSSPLRGMVHGTALMLLYLTGLRLGEALSLNLEDVDLIQGVLKIRQGKFGKSRLVPMAPDLTYRMRQCRRFVERFVDLRPSSGCFFPGPKGARCTKHALRYSFRKVLTAASIPWLGAGKGPRLHDLRHSFAVHRMILWYEQGADLGTKLPLLATYLGHVSLSSSQHYLRLTEDLLGEVTRRYQSRFGHLITERRSR